MKPTIFLLIGLLSFSAHAKWSSCGIADWECHERQHAVAAKKLQKIEPQLRRLNPTVADRFKVSQRLWLKFAEADCRMESEPAAESQGSGYARTYDRCMANIYTERLMQMEKIVEFLKR